MPIKNGKHAGGSASAPSRSRTRLYTPFTLAPHPLSAADIAASFRKGPKVESQVRATLAGMARMGFIAVRDAGTRFALRRAA